MTRWRFLGLFIAVTCVVWVAVLWHWQSTHRDMSTQDILLGLVALPVAATLFIWAGIRAWRAGHARVRPGAPARPETGGPGGPAGSAAQAPDAVGVHGWALRVAALRCAAGASLEELAQAVDEQAPRPVLDRQLRDGAGLPVMCARAPEADRQHDDDGAASPAPSASLARATHLLRAVWRECAARVEDLALAAAAAPGPFPVRAVSVVCACSSATTDAERAWTHAWCAGQLEHLAGEHPAVAWRLHGELFTDALALWQEVARRMHDMPREHARHGLLVLACHSDIDPAAIDRLDRAGQLFTSSRPRGRLVGEGAVALWLDPDLAAAPPVARVRLAAPARRPTSVDTRGPADPAVAAGLLQRAAAADGPGLGVAGISSDADQHTARGAEAFAAVMATLPDADAAQVHRPIGHLTGHLGAVAPWLALACAAHQVATSGAPWAALSVADGHTRLAARLDPPPTDGPSGRVALDRA